MKTAFLRLLAFIVLLSAGSASAERKMFIRQIALKGSCVKDVSEQALRALIAQEVPRDILKLRDMAYEDPSAYLSIGTLSSETFTPQTIKNVRDKVGKYDIKLMLDLEISCVPGPNGSPIYFLTGQMVDMEEMNILMNCFDREKKGQRLICNPKSDLYTAFTYAQIELTDFSNLTSSVRHLFARLLQIPEIEIHLETTSDVFHPGGHIEMHMSIRPNNPRIQGTPEYSAQIVRLPAEQQERICSRPKEYWEQLSCARSSGSAPCPESVPFKQQGSQIKLNAPIHEDDYLVRVEATSFEEGKKILSTPVFRCLHTRERKYQVGLSMRVAYPISNSYDRFTSSGREFRQTLDPMIFGLDVSFTHTSVRRRGALPGISLAAVLGGTFVQGHVSCEGPTECSAWSRTSKSWTTEARVKIQFDVLRFKQASLLLYTDIGLGMEWLTSDPTYDKDGAHGQLLGGAGMAWGGRGGLSANWDFSWLISLSYQARFRFTSDAYTAPDGQFLHAAISNLIMPLWLTLGLSLSSPLH